MAGTTAIITTTGIIRLGWLPGLSDIPASQPDVGQDKLDSPQNDRAESLSPQYLIRLIFKKIFWKINHSNHSPLTFWFPTFSLQFKRQSWRKASRLEASAFQANLWTVLIFCSSQFKSMVGGRMDEKLSHLAGSALVLDSLWLTSLKDNNPKVPKDKIEVQRSQPSEIGYEYDYQCARRWAARPGPGAHS